MRNILFLFFLSFFFSCKNDVLPKPKAYLSLTYPEKTYEYLELKRPYRFKVLKTATVINDKNNWLTIRYPKLKASIDITYIFNRGFTFKNIIILVNFRIG